MGYKGTRLINIDYDIYNRLLAKDEDLIDLEKTVKSSILIDTFVTWENSDFQKCLRVRPSAPNRSIRIINEFLEEMGESKINTKNPKDFIDGFETAMCIIFDLMEKETAEKKNRLDDIYDRHKADQEQNMSDI